MSTNVLAGRRWSGIRPAGAPKSSPLADAPYILMLMRRFLTGLGLLTLPVSPAVGQTASTAAPGAAALAPRAYQLMAMRAKITDSVAARSAAWRRWAAEAPRAVEPRFALALLARFDQRYGETYSWLDSAAALAPVPRWRSAIIRERIDALVTQGEYATVPALISQIADDSASIPLDEWAEVRLISLRYRRKMGGAFTLAALDSVDAMAAVSDSLLRARIACLRAVTDPRRRVAHTQAGIAMAEGAGALFISGNCALTLASLYAGSAEIDSAFRWFDQAEKTARAAHDEPTLAATLQWSGYSLSSLGHIPLATARLAEAIRVAQRVDDRNVEAWALLGIANASEQIGDAGTASNALRRAAILFDATADTYGAANARLQRASALIQLGDLQEAERLARGGKATGDSIRQPTLVLRGLYQLADIALRTRRLDESARLLDSAAALVATMGARYETQLNDYRGVLAVARGQYPEAIRLLNASAKRYAVAQNLFLHFVDGSLSLAWLRSGDSVMAAKHLVAANDDLDRLRDTIAGGGLRRVVTLPERWGGANSNLDHVLEAFVTSRRWLPTVFAVTERARSRALLKGSFGVVGADTTAAIVEARRRVRASATELRAVQRSLAPGTALLVYAGGTSSARTTLMVITRTSARGLTLAPLDSLDRDIVRWLALLESGETGAGAGRRVAGAVLASALRGLPASIKRLVIVPQGPLYRVPFQALPFGPGVLGDRAVVTIAPSVSLALAYAAEPRAVQARVLALGAGDTEVQSSIPQALELNIERTQRGNPLAALPAAADEARAAAGWGVGSVALTGAAASEGALKREARGTYSVLHTAAHALTSDQALGANYLILRADASDDGYVSGGELAALSSGRAMVVLSGCRTTGDFGSRGDAIDGLVAPLLARGVRTVVASHWAVSDRWTRVLMERFYQQLAAGATTAEAMNRAQTSLRRAGVPARFWAAFSVIGDGALTFTGAGRAPSGGH
jgi:tetratricopeptide (TPR) repeat protein